MEQILIHLFGDYISQTDWMAVNKVKNTFKGYMAAFIHALVYSLPFLLIGSWKAVIVIGVTHFLIDKYRLAVDLIRLKGLNKYDKSNFGFNPEMPFAMSIWLMIITDNTIHLIINFLAITYLF